MDTEKIRFLEKIAAAGHPGLESEMYDGWELRFSEGFTGRANSVSVYEPGKLSIEEKVEYCEKRYAEHNLPCNFKLTEADKELSDFLVKRGYSVNQPTDVMILRLRDLNYDSEEVLRDTEFTAEPEGWFEPYFEFEGPKDEKSQELCKSIHEKVSSEKLYVKVLHEGRAAAVSSTAVEEGYSLLHNVVVDSTLRGLGLGRKLCQATLEKSRQLGAEYSYLQVIQSNEIALNLYKKLGYEKLYTYWYVKK